MSKIHQRLTKIIKAHKISTSIVIILFLVLLSAFLGRGWIRGTLVPAYADWQRKPEVERAFNKNYPAIQSKLTAQGIPMPMLSSVNTVASCDSLTNDDSSLTFSGVHESVNCIQMLESKEVVLNSEFITAWDQQAAGLDGYLRTQGYHQEKDVNNPHTTLKHLFSLDTQDKEATAIYGKSIGGTICILQIYSMNYHHQDYAGYSTALEAPTALADYQCTNTLNLFGGYSYYR